MSAHAEFGLFSVVFGDGAERAKRRMGAKNGDRRTEREREGAAAAAVASWLGLGIGSFDLTDG